MSKIYSTLTTLAVAAVLCTACSHHEAPAPQQEPTKNISSTFTSNTLYIRSAVEEVAPVQEFVRSHLRSLNGPSSFTTEQYDFAHSEYAFDKSSSREVFVSRAKSQGNSFLCFWKDDDRIVAATRIFITEESDNSAVIELRSVLDNTLLIRGEIRKDTGDIKLLYASSIISGRGLRASAGGFLCNMAMWGAGASWAGALAMISGGASLAFGFAWTAASYFICDKAEVK